MNTVGIVTARGGSKGIPRKNLRPLCGKPLLQYTAEAALGARRLSRVVLSTDDEEIAEVGRACGLEVPFLRPPELATDVTPTVPVLQHAVAWLADRGSTFSAVCLLQPTTPLRTSKHIDDCIAMLEQSDADSVVSVLAVPHQYNPSWVFFQDRRGMLVLSTGAKTIIPRRQDLPPAFHRDGSVYVVRTDVLMTQHSLYGSSTRGYVMDPVASVNIDTPEDWARAEELIAAAATRVR